MINIRKNKIFYNGVFVATFEYEQFEDHIYDSRLFRLCYGAHAWGKLSVQFNNGHIFYFKNKKNIHKVIPIIRKLSKINKGFQKKLKKAEKSQTRNMKK